jgi:hypothetical protein
MPEPRKLRVFLCHASQDKPVVRELYLQLVGEGWIDPWLDQEKLLPGQDWGLEIDKAVENCDAVIICLSINSVTKEGYIQKEIRKVLDIALEKPEGAVFIIPLRLDDCEPSRQLAKWQYVDYFPKRNKNKAYKQLLESLNVRVSVLNIRAPKDSNINGFNQYEKDLFVLDMLKKINSEPYFYIFDLAEEAELQFRRRLFDNIPDQQRSALRKTKVIYASLVAIVSLVVLFTVDTSLSKSSLMVASFVLLIGWVFGMMITGVWQKNLIKPELERLITEQKNMLDHYQRNNI